mgnify:CR=1 FL=1
MKKGDLYKVISKTSHEKSQYGEFVVLLEPLGNGEYYWSAINLASGKWHHYRIIDLEFISASR